ncbi:class I SAM-dependent methyltransferase [Candidatus Leptofilum sp.]|uniref:class I SAM-dependent methyltransferase n=1 Tax=Candidatus Leptofilum sp. TaxID=3241576 RepID=UPI003B5A67BF
MSQIFSWQESDSEEFIDYGRYFVPQREYQLQTIADLIPRPGGEAHILELSCGEGLLAEELLRRFPDVTLYGYDLSPAMLEQATQRLAHFGDRFVPRQFDLNDLEWRTGKPTFHAVVSSLTVHHLDGPDKLRLFLDLYPMLLPGGTLVIADLVAPTRKLGTAVAAKAWDEAVRQRSQQLDGNDDGLTQFERLKWNLYRYPEDPETAIDKPSSLLDQLKWVEQAGFTAVDVHWMLAGHVIYSGVKR